MSRELNMDKIMIRDIIDICKEEVIDKDSNNRNKFSTKSLDKKLSKIGKEIFNVDYMGKDKDLEKTIKKLEKLLPKVQKMEPNIEMIYKFQGSNEIVSIEDSNTRGSLNMLKQLFDKAKENEVKMRDFRKEQAKREKELARKQAQEEKDANNPDKIAAREDAQRNRESANNIWRLDVENRLTKNERAAREDANREYKETGIEQWSKIEKANQSAQKKLEEAGLRKKDDTYDDR